MPGTKSENAAKWAEVPKEKLEEILNAMALRLADALSEDLGNDSLEIVKLPEMLAELKLDEDPNNSKDENVDPNLAAYERLKTRAKEKCTQTNTGSNLKKTRKYCVDNFLKSYFEFFDQPELEKIHAQSS